MWRVAVEAGVRVGPRISHHVGLSLLVDDCAISVFAKTSGFLLVFGVGSYVAYRVCVRLFGPDFFRSLFHQAKQVLFPDVELPLLSVEEAYKCGSVCDFLADDEWSEGDEDDVQSIATTTTTIVGESKEFQSQIHKWLSGSDLASFPAFEFGRRHSSPWRRRQSSGSTQTPAPLARCLQGSLSHGASPLRCRRSSKQKATPAEEGDSESSDGWFARSPPPIRRRRPKTLAQDDAVSIVSSNSTNGQFLWDHLCSPAHPDDNLQHLMELADPLRVILAQSPAPSELSCYSEFSREVTVEAAEYIDRLQGDIGELKAEVKGLDWELEDLLERSHCRQDAKHLYRSVVVDSEQGSTCSLPLARSLDSCMDHSPSSSDELQLSSSSKDKLHTSFVDSAIWTDPGSSDGSEGVGGWLSRSRSFGPSLGVTPEEPPRCSDEELSMEWDEMSVFKPPPAPLPPDATDLLHFIKDLLPSPTPVLMKVVNKLYKHRKLQYTVDLAAESSSLLWAVLYSILHQRASIFKCSHFKIVSDAVQMSLRRCSFLAKWPFQALSDSDQVQKLMIKCLRSLWDLNELAKNEDLNWAQRLHNSSGERWEFVEGLKILMVLRALEVFEEAVVERSPCKSFHADLFQHRSPPNIMRQLSDLFSERPPTSMEIGLVADTLDVRLELFQAASQTCTVFPDSLQSGTPVALLDLGSGKIVPLFPEQ